MTVKRSAAEGLAFGAGVAIIGGAVAWYGWRWLAPQIVGIAGAAGSAAGEEASHQITTGVQGQAPAIGAAIGQSATDSAAQRAGQILGSASSEDAYSGPVTLGGVPVEVT